MGEAMVRGLIDADWAEDAIAIAESDAERRRELEHQWPGVRVVPSPAWAVAEADVVVLAVKPADIISVLETLLPTLEPGALVVSIAAGVRIDTIEAVLPDHPVVRAMPNTPALIGEGAAAIAAGTKAEAAHMDRAEAILGALGLVVRVKESALDAVTGLSGSGPAYIFMIAEALIEAGVLVGLPRDDASRAGPPDDSGCRQADGRRSRHARNVAGNGDVARRHDCRGPRRDGTRWCARSADRRGRGRHQSLSRTRWRWVRKPKAGRLPPKLPDAPPPPPPPA